MGLLSPVNACIAFRRDQNTGLVPQHSGDSNLSHDRTWPSDQEVRLQPDGLGLNAGCTS